MDQLLKKLNYKPGQNIYLSNTPEELVDSFKQISKREGIKMYPDASKLDKVDFAVVFVKTLAEIEDGMKRIKDKISSDPTIWFSYPKSTSKRYKCEFNRDNGWDVMAEYDLEPVRQVSISDDWSGLRFRLVVNIKTMVRSFALTKRGKQKVKETIGKN